MNREELKEKIAEVLRSHSTGIPFVNLSLERAEEILTVIEGTGCTICPNEPTLSQVHDGFFELRYYDKKQSKEGFLATAMYRAMLSASPLSCESKGEEDKR
jgi:hypothetical protein